MTVDEIISALALPASSLVDQRIPKKLLLENAAITSTDRRAINEGVEEVRWVAALKPNTIGVPAYRDDTREYLEIAVISVTLRVDRQNYTSRLAELVHRSIPYPVLLILTGLKSELDAAQPTTPVVLSLAHIRWAQNEAQRVVLENTPESVTLSPDAPENPYAPFFSEFREQLAISAPPIGRRSHMLALYQGWMDAFVALQSAGVTGRFVPANDAETTAARRAALRALRDCDTQIAALTTTANKERQLPRRVDLNLQIQVLRADRAATITLLG